ncbi:alpha/beta-Hydrolases superfamily protein [Actinidia rufa]|uniref:Alpha/beta-Hydrolases superfamily protein n=1 Tax=Actinidia rufa TaxID=165716 RepID=A0A7J0FVM2_9ERIC|nr:alpha/beta-Hydrolases superfamily protein [Actinidia rufa]
MAEDLIEKHRKHFDEFDFAYSRGLDAWLIAGSNANSSFAVHVAIDPADSKAAVVNATSTSASESATLRARFIGQGYKQAMFGSWICIEIYQVCGQADVWGDGVVTEVAAHLEGALNMSFNGVYHSPVGSDDASRPWYGSPAIVEQWIQHLLNFQVNPFSFYIMRGGEKGWELVIGSGGKAFGIGFRLWVLALVK